MNRNRKRRFQKAMAAALSATVMTAPIQVGAANSYVTDNTETVMQNASSEGGGMVYNLEKPSEEEYAQLKNCMQSLKQLEKPNIHQNIQETFWFRWKMSRSNLL